MEKEDLQIKLSIITPYYKTIKQIFELASVLEPQLNDNVEWIIIDDGCSEIELDKLKARVIHSPTNSGNASVPRNIGLDNAKGEYIAFIDSDDIIKDNYIKKILEKTQEGYDYFYISWESQFSKIIICKDPPEWNCSVWSCVYKKSLIGEERFDKNLVVAEDYDFNQRVKKGSYSSITDILYYYNNTPNSLSKRPTNGTVEDN